MPDQRVLYIEGNAGASGDMILASLIDLGYPVEHLKETLSKLPVPLKISSNVVHKNGIKARTIKLNSPKTGKKKWTLNNFTSALNESKLPSPLKEKSKSLFERLASAEGKIHGKHPESVHFHELGGWDTLANIVGSLAALAYFNLHEIWIGPLNVGGGTAQGEHGTIPLPCPVVLDLLKGFTIYSSGDHGELTTPTGALILASMGKTRNNLPAMELEEVGYGAGKKEFPFPNTLRALLGKAVSELREDKILKLETNIDDMNPQLWEHVFDKLYETGAAEVFLTPVVMKKSRPACVLTVLAPLDHEEHLLQVLFSETTTLGIRRELVPRVLLERKIVEVTTPYGKIPCKVGYRHGKMVNIAPEYEAVKMISKEKNQPLKKIYQSVLRELPQPIA